MLYSSKRPLDNSFRIPEVFPKKLLKNLTHIDDEIEVILAYLVHWCCFASSFTVVMFISGIWHSFSSSRLASRNF